VEDWQDLVLTLEAWLLLAAPGALLLALWWLVAPRPRPPWLPRICRVRWIPWTGFEVFTSFVLVIAIPMLVDETLRELGVFDWLYGADADPSTRGRQRLWTVTLGTPLALVLILYTLWKTRRARPADYGLAPTRIGANLRLGYVAWLLAHPVAMLVLFGMLVLIGEDAAEEHPLTEAARAGLSVDEWILLAISAVVLAPLAEELVFRGVLLPWQLRGQWERQAMIAACAFVMAAVMGLRAPPKPYRPETLLFVLAMLPGLVVLPYVQLHRAPPDPEMTEPPANGLLEVLRCAGDRRAQAPLAIYTNGVFFGAMHAGAWPSPVPLFLLGMVLAWLRYRSSSLVGALTVHALFNATALIALALEHLS